VWPGIISVGTPRMPKVATALIAKLTKRTEGSLRQKARKLCISLGSSKRNGNSTGSAFALPIGERGCQ
jgi:hypothetical protein